MDSDVRGGRFFPRSALKDHEWDEVAKTWQRPKVDQQTLQRLNRRSALEGSLRVLVHFGLAVVAARRHIALAIVPFFPYCWLDEHVEHHLFPGVPSRNLGKLRAVLDIAIPPRINVIACWQEIYAIAAYRQAHPDAVFVPAGVVLF